MANIRLLRRIDFEFCEIGTFFMLFNYFFKQKKKKKSVIRMALGIFKIYTLNCASSPEGE